MKSKKNLGFKLCLLFIAVSSLFIVVACDDYTDTVTESENTSVSSSFTVTDLIIQPGSDETMMNFCWYTSDTTDAEIQIALESAMTDSDFPEAAATTYSGTGTISDTYVSNKVEVSNLESDTDYVYRVGNGADFSEVYSFSTRDDSNYNFIVVGDPQIGSSGSVSSDQEGWEDTVTQAISTFEDSCFILSVGDQVNDSDDEDQYTAFFAPEELTNVPFVSVIGNHDNASLYQSHFNSPNESSDYGITDAGGDYYFTYGNALFMVLNTNNSSVTSHQEFIENTIADADSDIVWKIVVFHHSIYSSAKHSADKDILELRSGLYPVFDDNDIDVVLMGHDHVYSRSYQMLDGEAQTDQTTDADGNVVNPTGTLYITVNSASGSKYYDLVETDTAYRAARWQGEEPSYSCVEITDSSFSITTYTSDDNEQIDTYSISKTD
jgi:predicted phosphodiesterase